MKLIIEPKDITDVQAVASLYSVTLTEQEARDILEKNRSYAGEVYKWGADDTDVREELGRLLKRLGKIA